MPRAEQEALEVARIAATGPDGVLDEKQYFDVFKAEYERRLAERHQRLMSDTRAVFRALDGWQHVKDADAWKETVRKAAEDLETSEFLIDRLGSERYLDPELMATLLVLRRRLIDEYGSESAADLMLIDVAVLSYYHTIRINGWIGNFASMLEAEFFGKEGLRVNVQGEHRSSWDLKIRGLRAEDIVERIGEQLVPLLDRSNRMMLRNLKALQARRGGPMPSVSIGSAGQVNVATEQVNSGPESWARLDADADGPRADPA